MYNKGYQLDIANINSNYIHVQSIQLNNVCGSRFAVIVHDLLLMDFTHNFLDSSTGKGTFVTMPWSYWSDREMCWPYTMCKFKIITTKWRAAKTSVYFTGQAVHIITLIARFMGPTWGPSGDNRTQVGPMLAPWTLLPGYFYYVWKRAAPESYIEDWESEFNILSNYFIRDEMWHLVYWNAIQLMERTRQLVSVWIMLWIVDGTNWEENYLKQSQALTTNFNCWWSARKYISLLGCIVACCRCQQPYSY